MTLIGHECNKPLTSKATGNIVHSINRSKGGVGAIVTPDYSSSSQTGTCFEASGIISYKNKYQGVHWMGSAGPTVIFSNMTGIDNGLGLGIGLTGGKNSFDPITLKFRDSKIYGFAPAPDCPQGGKGGYCDKSTRCGLMSAVSLTGAKPIHPTMPSPKPYHKCKSYGTWGATAIFENMIFNNFYDKT